MDEEWHCPSCEREMVCVAMMHCLRQEDGVRVCRAILRCTDRHVWWVWSDRPYDPPEPDPFPEFHGGVPTP